MPLQTVDNVDDHKDVDHHHNDITNHHRQHNSNNNGQHQQNQIYDNHINHHHQQQESSSSTTSLFIVKKQIDRKTVSIIYTISLYYSFIAVGLCCSIFNPTLLQLSYIFGTNLENVSFIFPLRAIGCTVGTLINGILNSYFNRQILLIMFIILKALTTFLVPHWTDIKQFYVNAFFNGFFTAVVVVMVNVWINEMWSSTSKNDNDDNKNIESQQNNHERNSMNNNIENGIIYSHSDDSDTHDDGHKSRSFKSANVTMQALHFFFGTGTILGPMVAEPFLRDSFYGYDNRFVANNLVWPYTISAILAISASLIILILYIIMPYEQPTKSLDKSKALSESTENLLMNHYLIQQKQKQDRNIRLFKYSVVALASLFLALYSFSEATYLQFSASFCSKIKLHLSQSQSALISSALAMSFTVFRGISAFIAMKLSPITMIVIDYIVITIGNILVYTLADTQIIGLIVGYILLGAGFSSVVPSLFPLLEQCGYTVTDWIGSIITFSNGLAQVLAPYVIGLWIDYIPYVLVDFTFISIATSTLMFIIMIIIMKYDHKKQRQYRQLRQQQQQQSNQNQHQH